MQKQRGGARQGSGRKPAAVKKVVLNMKIDPGLKAKAGQYFPRKINKKVVDFLQKEVDNYEKTVS